jgi:hypothetical protein
MAALGTTDIGISLVKTTLGEDNYSLFSLGTSDQINKWSRFKPIRDASGLNIPAGSNSKYGLNLPTNWNYLQPRGISENEPVRLGDFRGYEHDMNIAYPIIYCDVSNISVPSTITPNLTGSGCVGSFVANKTVIGENVKILLSDLGYGSYYWGLKVGSYYKTFGIASDGTSLSFELTLDLTDPAAPSFVGFPTPVSMDPGTITWRLFIASTAATSWTITAPKNYIEFPGGVGETCGSIVIQSNGSFVLTHWIASMDTSFGWGYDEGTYTYAEESYIVTSNSNWHVHTIPAGFGIKDSGGADIAEETGSFSSGSLIHLYVLANNSTYTPIIGSFIFHDNDHNECELEVMQSAAPEPVAITVALSQGNVNFKAYEYAGSAPYTGSNTVNLVVVVDYQDENDLSDHSIGYTITHNGDAAGSGNITIHASTGTPTLVDVVLSAGAVETGDTVVVTLDAITP